MGLAIGGLGLLAVAILLSGGLSMVNVFIKRGHGLILNGRIIIEHDRGFFLRVFVIVLFFIASRLD